MGVAIRPSSSNEQTEQQDNVGKSIPRVIRSLVTFCLCGLVFGFLFERSHVYEPQGIRNQFIFYQWVMLKMFIGAMVGSWLSFLLHAKINNARFENARNRLLYIQPWYLVIAGSSLLGIGMVVCGGCPGMVLPQVGTGVRNSGYTLLGGFVAAVIASIIKKRSNSWKVKSVCEAGDDRVNAQGSCLIGAKLEKLEGEKDRQFVDRRFKLNQTLLFVGALFACIIAVIVLEILIPYKEDVLALGNAGIIGSWFEEKNVFLQRAWYPSICGLGIGLLNFFIILETTDTLGSSTGYESVAKLLTWIIPASGSEGDSESKDKKKSISIEDVHRYILVNWQLFYLPPAIVGAYLSGLSCDTVPSQARGVSSPAVAFCGGFLMLIGSRFSGGCTSGHGIAGTPLLNIYAIIGVCCMFGAGIITAIIMNAAGVLELEVV